MMGQIQRLVKKWEREAATTGQINHSKGKLIEQFLTDLRRLQRSEQKELFDAKITDYDGERA